MEKIIIKAENLSKVYGNDENKTTALKNVNLTVNEGEIVSIVGKSGSGKSTLLYILSGVEQATKGNVLFFLDKNLSSLKAKERSVLRLSNIGFVFQFFNLVPEYCVIDNILLPSILGKKTSQREYAEELLKKVGLENKAKSYPSQLSGGEQQRVAIVRALINNPSVIFADEPTGNLDSQTGKQVFSLLLDLVRQNKQTLIYVTHDLEFSKWADRRITLLDGEISDES